MKVERVYHIRLPLVINNSIGKRHVSPTLVPDRAGFYGGATVLVEGDQEKPGMLQVRVAFCRWSDNYNRKLGVKVARTTDPEVIALRELPKVLAEVEEQALVQSIPWLRNAHRVGHKHQKYAEEDLLACVRNWDHAVKHFLPRGGNAS